MCLAGSLACNDWRLIQMLKMVHQVTLIEELKNLWHNPILQTAGVLVVCNSVDDEPVIDRLPRLTKRHPRLAVLLVNGGLNQGQVAQAFQAGACDYFPAPYDVGLLAERVSSLCARAPARIRK